MYSVHGYPPELDSKTLLLKTPRLKPYTMGNWSCYWPGTIIPTGSLSECRDILCNLPNEKSIHQSYAAANCVIYKSGQPHCQHISSMNVMKGRKYFLIRFKAFSLLPISETDIGTKNLWLKGSLSRGEPTAITLSRHPVRDFQWPLYPLCLSSATWYKVLFKEEHSGVACF